MGDSPSNLSMKSLFENLSEMVPKFMRKGRRPHGCSHSMQCGFRGVRFCLDVSISSGRLHSRR